MRWADVALVQGAGSVLSLNRDSIYLTGNPRYQSLSLAPRPPAPKAFVNCNFTYGVFEDWRDRWLGDVVEALEGLGIDYLISQHPRDRADLSHFSNVQPSNASVVHEQLRECSIVISRFSSVMHEGVCTGRAVVYYNPMGEDMGYDFQPDGRVFSICHSPAEMREIITGYSRRPASDGDFERYATLHFKPAGDRAAATVAELLLTNRFAASGQPVNLPKALARYAGRRIISGVSRR
jgi:hypothetical protein